MDFQRFDIAEDVIPTTAVQTNNMVTQHVKDFIHLEHGGQRFNQQRRLDGAARQIKAIFCMAERLRSRRPASCEGLGFRQIEIGTTALCQQCLIVVEEIERKIKQAAGDCLTTPVLCFFRQVQTAYPTNQNRWIGLELVNFACFIGVTDGAVNRITQVNLPVDHFVPVWCQ